jgi:CheY-like chemotaxis protein
MSSKKTILIIDDDQRNIFALTAVLKAKNFFVVSAASMEEAFVLLQSNTEIGIVLMDMMMPGMDGYEAIPRIKLNEQYRHLPVIAVTAQAMAGDKEKALAAGADDYIPKPVDVDLLLEILKHHLK